MTIAEMLSQSGILTLLGLGVVFSFLIILIICMTLLHAVIKAFHLDKDLQAKPESKAPAAPAADNGAVIAAIAAALHEKEC